MNKKHYAFFLKKNRRKPRHQPIPELNYFTVEENNNTNKNNETNSRNCKRKMSNV